MKRDTRPLLAFVLCQLLLAVFCLRLLAQSRPAPAAQGAVPNTTAAAAPAILQTYQGNPDVKVWVNTASGVYHCPGSRWYGSTKHGEFMTQAEAQKKHYRPAYGKVCR